MLWINYLTGEHESTAEPVSKIVVGERDFTITTQSGAEVGRSVTLGFSDDTALAKMMILMVDATVITDKLIGK